MESLLPHQKQALKLLVARETTRIDSGRTIFRSKVGVYSDPQQTGRKTTMSALIASGEKFQLVKFPINRTSNPSKFPIATACMCYEASPYTVIFTKAKKIQRWQEALSRFNLESIVVRNGQQAMGAAQSLKGLEFSQNSNQMTRLVCDVIIVSNIRFNKTVPEFPKVKSLVELFSRMCVGLCFQRVIFDDAPASAPMIPAGFTWFLGPSRLGKPSYGSDLLYRDAAMDELANANAVKLPFKVIATSLNVGKALLIEYQRKDFDIVKRNAMSVMCLALKSQLSAYYKVKNEAPGCEALVLAKECEKALARARDALSAEECPITCELMKDIAHLALFPCCGITIARSAAVSIRDAAGRNFPCPYCRTMHNSSSVIIIDLASAPLDELKTVNPLDLSFEDCKMHWKADRYEALLRAVKRDYSGLVPETLGFSSENSLGVAEKAQIVVVTEKPQKIERFLASIKVSSVTLGKKQIAVAPGDLLEKVIIMEELRPLPVQITDVISPHWENLDPLMRNRTADLYFHRTV